MRPDIRRRCADRQGDGRLPYAARPDVRGRAITDLCRRFPRLHLVELPSYAPELNPVEHVWGHTKHDDLANYIPEDIEVLAADVDNSLGHTSSDQSLLRGFFRLSKLRL